MKISRDIRLSIKTAYQLCKSRQELDNALSHIFNSDEFLLLNKRRQIDIGVWVENNRDQKHHVKLPGTAPFLGY